jgi:hypothetical protein
VIRPRRPTPVPAVRVPWYRRPALWLRAWRARRQQRKRAHERELQVRGWMRRARAGEDICIGCGGFLQRLRVAPQAVTVRDHCRYCVGANPVVAVELARCTVCGRKDPTRTITVPVDMDHARMPELAQLVAGVCTDCAARMASSRGRA